MNDQGVKVFGLTGDAPREALPSANAPRGFDVNPNVEIFPLDGGVHQPAMNQPSFAPRAYTPQTTPVPHQAHAANHGDVVYFDHDSVALDRNDLAVIRRVAQNCIDGACVCGCECIGSGWCASDGCENGGVG